MTHADQFRYLVSAAIERAHWSNSALVAVGGPAMKPLAFTIRSLSLHYMLPTPTPRGTQSIVAILSG